MKWKIKPIPRVSSFRTISKFALIPTRLTSPYEDTLVWLESYKSVEIYESIPYEGCRWVSKYRSPINSRTKDD